MVPPGGRAVTEQELGSVEAELSAHIEASYLFRSLDEAGRRSLIESGYVLSFDEGDTILRQGEPGDTMFLVLSGSVNIFHDEDGSETRLAKLGEGACLGEVSVLTGGPRTATVRARSARVDLICLHKHRIERILTQYPKVKAVLESVVARRAQITIDKLRR